ELFEAEGDALLGIVEVEDDHVEFLVELHDFFRMVHAAPAEVGDVDETVYAAQVDEYAVGGDVLDGAFEELALLDLGHDFLLLVCEFLLDERLVRNDHVAELLVDFHYLEFHGLVHVHVVVADGLHVYLRTGQERFDAEYVHNHTALGAALDVALDYLVVFEGLVYPVPGLELARVLVREHELALLVFGAFHIYLDPFAYGEFGVVAEFGYRDDTFRFVADVHDDF